MKAMATRLQRNERRADALSKQRIVETAIEILDEGGERALTFRVLSARLATGSGALYWHVANRDELLNAATTHVTAHLVTEAVGETTPQDVIRSTALGMFDTIDAHPWVGPQLSREPWQPVMLHLFERVGQQLQALHVPDWAQFDAWSALVNYILGVAGQNAENVLLQDRNADRAAFLNTVAARWAQLDPAQYPFLHHLAAGLHGHDDRMQFLAGINLILAGIATLGSN